MSNHAIHDMMTSKMYIYWWLALYFVMKEKFSDVFIFLDLFLKLLLKTLEHNDLDMSCFSHTFSAEGKETLSVILVDLSLFSVYLTAFGALNALFCPVCFV